MLPLTGAATVQADGEHVHARKAATDVFAAVSDFVYVPRDAHVDVASERGGRFALPSSRAGRRLEARYVAADDVPVELRGAGQASRQVNNFCSPDAFEADRLIAVEVLTPGGNWSSYPPHKHDEDIPGVETALEEIYYFEVANGGFGYQRVYGSGPGREIDITQEVRTGDAIVMPHGYHGPSMAAPGYDLYYLNVMAGPGERAWRFTDDPAHAWIRDTWAEQELDPRLPMTRRQRMRLTVAQALVRFLAGPVQRARRRRAAPDRGLLRDLRPRQRRRRRPGAARAAATRCPSTTPATSRRWCTPRSATRARRTASPRSPARPRSAPARRTWSPARRWRRSTACPSCCCPATSSPPARSGTVLQELEDPTHLRRHVNDTLKPVSRFWDRIERPEQLTPALLAAMRVLTDPAETGAVTLALPQDVQAEALRLAARSCSRSASGGSGARSPSRTSWHSAAELLRTARKPLIVAGGGTIYAEATDALRELAEATGIGVGETQAGKGSLPYDHPQALGAIGATGTTAANAAAREADVILGVGTRWSDFTTASPQPLQRRRPLHQPQRRRRRRLQARRAAARRRRPARPRGAERSAGRELRHPRQRLGRDRRAAPTRPATSRRRRPR